MTSAGRLKFFNIYVYKFKGLICSSQKYAEFQGAKFVQIGFAKIRGNGFYYKNKFLIK